MIHRTTPASESVIVHDASVMLWVVSGAVGVLVLATVLLLVVRAARRRRAAPRGRTDEGAAGYSAGVARVRNRDGSSGGSGSDGNGPGRRTVIRLFGPPGRSIGLDAARGAALLALAAIVWFESSGDGAEPVRRLAEIAGFDPERGVADLLARASDGTVLVFVLISGVAIALTSGGAAPVEGVERLRVRMRLAVRAIVLLGIGGVAAFSDGAFAGLVATIAALSLVGLAVVGWRAGTLFLAGVLWTVVVPAPAAGLAAVIEGSRTLIAPPLEWALAGPYPPVPLVGVLFAGMALGRLNPSRLSRRWIVFAAASGCALLAFGAGAVTPSGLAESVRAGLSTAPGSMMPLALLGTGGVALALVTLAVIAGRALRWVLVLFSAAGSMATTLWIASLGAVGAVWVFAPSIAVEGMAAVLDSGPMAGLGGAVPEPVRSIVMMACVLLLVGVVCVAWRLILGDGPVEGLVRLIGEAATRVPERLVVSGDDARAAEASALLESDFDAVIRGRDAVRDTPYGAAPPVTPPAGPSAPAVPSPAAAPPGTAPVPPDTRPVRRPTIAPVDPVTAATQWTPGQTLGRLPY